MVKKKGSKKKIIWFSIILISLGIFVEKINIITKILMIVLSPIIIQFYFFIKKKGSLGASDNLISSMILIELAKIFKLKGLKKTKLILLSADGEEVGLKGSEHFIKKEKKNYRRIQSL